MNLSKTVFNGKARLDAYPDLLRVPEVADLLGISDKTVYALIQSEEIKSVKPGRAYLVPKTSILKYCKIYL